MKESRFIELLNLYIDQQIPPEDAAALEEEIMADPRRRRTYLQYCRMHRACTLVFESTHGEPSFSAPSGPAGSEGRGSASHRRTGWSYYAAGLAAAACLSLVAVRVLRHPAMAPMHDGLAAVPAAAAVPVTGAPVRAATPWTVNAPLTPPVFSREANLTLAGFALANLGARPAADPLRPTVEEFVFEQGAPAQEASPAFRNRRRPGDGDTEMTAFQFQR